MTRREFPESVKRAALERAQHRCQDPLCGVSEEWRTLRIKLMEAEITVRARLDGLQFWDLLTLRDNMLVRRRKYPRLLNPIIKRFQLDASPLLEIDHEREDADGGEPTLANAVVRCVFCHQFKTQDRARARRAAPKKAAPEQLDVLKTAKVEGLRAVVKEKLVGSSVSHRGRDLGALEARSLRPGERHRSVPEAHQTTKRRYTDAEVTAAAQRWEQAAIDWPWGA